MKLIVDAASDQCPCQVPTLVAATAKAAVRFRPAIKTAWGVLFHDGCLNVLPRIEDAWRWHLRGGMHRHVQRTAAKIATSITERAVLAATVHPTRWKF